MGVDSTPAFDGLQAADAQPRSRACTFSEASSRRASEPIHRALRDSRFFIACLSRTYLRSDACRWEWEEWCRHELEHGLVGQGAASLWFVKLEDLDAPEDAALLRRWKGDLLQRFHIQCHEWRHDDHGNFLDAAARSELQQLTEHVAQRLRLLTLDRGRRGDLRPPVQLSDGQELSNGLRLAGCPGRRLNGCPLSKSCFKR